MAHDDHALITDVLVRYATAIDTRDWALFRSCFTDGVTSDYGPIGRWGDIDGLTGFMTTAHAGMGHTLHRITNASTAGHGASATARSYVHVILQLDASRPNVVYETFGFYDDELVRADDNWRISRRVFTTVAERSF